jgi:hypothetical protein
MAPVITGPGEFRPPRHVFDLPVLGRCFRVARSAAAIEAAEPGGAGAAEFPVCSPGDGNETDQNGVVRGGKDDQAVLYAPQRFGEVIGSAES